MSRVTRVWATRLSMFVCGLGGHELLLNAEPGRLSLKCMSCPYETPGWTIKTRTTFDDRSNDRRTVVLADRRPSAIVVS